MGVIVVIVVAVGIGFGVLATNSGQIHISFFTFIVGMFALCLVMLIGGIFSRDHNRDRDINGEILTKKQRFIDDHYKLVNQARGGRDVDCQLRQLEQEQKEFESTIEYGIVTDGSENYYSYRGKK